MKDKLGIEDDVEIDRCCRMKKSGKDRLNNERNLRPRAIICRLLRFKDKQRIIQRIQVSSFLNISAKILWTFVNSYGRRYWNIESTTKFPI